MVETKGFEMSLVMQGPLSKTEAKKRLRDAGYVFEKLGESGDYGYGSREYWVKPNSPKNEFGSP